MDENKEGNTKHTDRNSKLSNILTSLKFVLLAEHLAGIYRFSFKDGKIIPTTWIKKTYGLCLIIWYVTFYVIFLSSILIDGKSNLVEVVDEIPIIFVLILFVTTVTTTNTYFSKANEELFISFANLDCKLITSSNYDFYEKARAKNNKFIFIFLACHIVTSITDIVTEGKAISPTIVIVLPLYLTETVEIIVFCLVIEMLKSRLDVINGFIAKFLGEQHGDKVSIFTVYGRKEVVKEAFNMIGRPSDNNMKIRDLATTYDTIGTLCFMVNSIFNFQIFVTLVSTFTYIVIAIWTSLYYYHTPEINSGQLFTVFIWCLATLMAVAVMCFVCERLRLSRNDTKILVNEIIMNYDLPKTMRMQAKAFMELIEAWPLSILIYDMFSVDITLMLKFMSVSTTYLIVIIQVSHLM